MLFPLFAQLDCPQQTEPGQPETISYSVWYLITLLLLPYYIVLFFNDHMIFLPVYSISHSCIGIDDWLLHSHLYSNNNRFISLCLQLSRWASTRRNIYPLTPILIVSHPYQLAPSTTIHSILPVQLRVWQSFLHNLCPWPLWSISWPGTLHFILHTKSLSSFRGTCPYHRNLFCCSTEIISSNPSLSLNPLLGTLSCSLMPYIHTLGMQPKW